MGKPVFFCWEPKDGRIANEAMGDGENMTTSDSDESELVPGARVSFRWADGDVYEGRIVSLTASDAVVMLESGRTTTVELSALGERDRRDPLEVKKTSERDAARNARNAQGDLAAQGMAFAKLVVVVAAIVAFAVFRGCTR